MSKKRIIIIIMLVVLAAGIGLAVYGVTGTAIYDNAAAMMGGDKKAAMGYIQEPEKLKELSSLEKLGADKVRSFLKGLGLDAARVDAAVPRISWEMRDNQTLPDRFRIWSVFCQ